MPEASSRSESTVAALTDAAPSTGLRLAEVVIPFQCFSGPPGTSTWDQHAADPVIGPRYMVARQTPPRPPTGCPYIDY